MDQNSKQRAGLWQVSLRVFRLVWDAVSSLLIPFVILEMVNAFLPYLSLWMGKLVIDHFTNPGNPSAATGVIDQTLLRISISFLAIQVSARLFSSIDNLFSPVLVDRVNGHAILLLLQKIGSFGELSIFEQPSFYDILKNAEEGISGRPARMLLNYMNILFGSVGLISFFIILAQIHIVLPLLIISIMILLTRFQFLFWKQNWSIFWQNTEDTRKMDYYKAILTEVNYAKEVRLFNLSGYLIHRWQTIFMDLYHRIQTARVKAGRPILVLSVVSGLLYGAAFFYAVWTAVSGKSTLGDLAIFVGAIIQTDSVFRPLIGGIGNLYEDSLYMSNLFSFLDLKPHLEIEIKKYHLRKDGEKLTRPTSASPDDPSSQQEHGITRGDCKEIDVRGLTFSYPGTERKVLDNVSFCIQPGETIAIVGENGAGKSTLVKLLLRFYDPDGGTIHWGTTDIQEIPILAWRRQISAVFQDFASYALDAQTNIGIGELEWLNDLEKIQSAAQKAGIRDLIEQLPQKYGTPLGRRFTGGVDLSGGEWHKIALARGFIRESSANLLILDEPMAALDARAEYDLYKRFKALSRGKSTILISHRFSNVRLADRILVMDNGKLVEEGTHQHLVDLGGIYANLYALQVEQFFGASPVPGQSFPQAA